MSNCWEKKTISRTGRHRVKLGQDQNSILKLVYTLTLSSRRETKLCILYEEVATKSTKTSCCSHDYINKIFKLQKTLCSNHPWRPTTPWHCGSSNILGWVPYNIESDIKRCLMAHKRIMGTRPDYINVQLEPNNSQHSRNTRGANLTILPRRYIREKEGDCTFPATTSRRWNHLPLWATRFSVCKYFEEYFV